jgi:biotin transport system substrate-specific component
MNDVTTTIPAAIREHVVRGSAAMNVLLIAGASCLIALAAQIAIPVPFSPVPLTMQPIAVLMIGAVLGSWRGAAAASLYLLEGFAGAPVFAQGHGGAAWLIGPTAGYLWSYPAAAWVAGWFSQRGWGSTRLRAICGMLAALGVIYAGGWSWLAGFMGISAAFFAGVSTYIVPDILKIALAAAFLPEVEKLIARTGE